MEQENFDPSIRLFITHINEKAVVVSAYRGDLELAIVVTEKEPEWKENLVNATGLTKH